MATTNLRFITLPADNITGNIIVPSTPYSTSAGIQVGCYDDFGVLQTAETRQVNIRVFSVLAGGGPNIRVTPVNGIATFASLVLSTTNLGAPPANAFLAATLVGAGGVPEVDQYFTSIPPARINPAEITGTMTNSGDIVGPYRYRAGKHMQSIRVSAWGQPTVVGAIDIVAVEPGLLVAGNNPELVANVVTTAIDSPGSYVVDKMEMGGQCDIWLRANKALGGPVNVKIQRSY